MINPYKIINDAIKQLPSLKYALGVLAIVSVIAIALSFGIDNRVAIIGSLLVIFLMVLLLIFSRLVSGAKKEFYLPAVILLWFVLIASIITMSLMITSVFWGTPINWKNYFEPEKTKKELIGITLLKEDDLNNNLKNELDSFKGQHIPNKPASKEDSRNFITKVNEQEKPSNKKESNRINRNLVDLKEEAKSKKEIPYQEIIKQKQKNRKFVGEKVRLSLEYERPKELLQSPGWESSVKQTWEDNRYYKGLLVDYEYTMQKDTMVINPVMGYLEKIKNGENVRDTYTPWITWKLPIVSAVIDNVTKDNLVIIDLEIEVLSSSLNREPFIIFSKLFEISNTNSLQLDLTNLGWGKIKNASIKFGFYDSLYSQSSIPSKKFPTVELFIGNFDESKRINTNSIITDILRKAKKPRAVGLLAYDDEYGNHKIVNFDIELALDKDRSIYNGGWAFPGYLYNIKLEHKETPYSIYKNISQIIKPDSVEVLAISFYSPISASYVIKLKFRKNNGDIMESGIIKINTLFPRSFYADESSYFHLVNQGDLKWRNQ